MHTVHLTPAFGRDYKSRSEIQHALLENRDFILNNPADRYDGKPVNAEQLVEVGYTHAQVRYAGQRKVALIPLRARP